ncbi:MAG: DNA methyltransferase [Bowdeniella nasicola]|nr:DNA methyltransferase [Bowdeniella nasicola]
MSRLTDILREIHKVNPRLGTDLEQEIRALTQRRNFGLVFERHQPEAVELPSVRLKRGSKVRILQPRGSTAKGDNRLWLVDCITRIEGVENAQLVELYAEEPEQREVAVDDLVVVAEFKDGIFPGLVETGRVERGGDKPFHTVINAENFHALEMLTYTHRGKIDAIYIDPPYNTGAKDWKYNNDYVEGDDAYRHSKWLAMMERRLLIAKELLNPNDSVLIVTIDEKEYLRLGILLEQIFPEARIQMISSIISRSSAKRSSSFSRTDEYVYFVMLGDCKPIPVALGEEWQSSQIVKQTGLRHMSLRRTGSNPRREDRPGCFYPIFVKETPHGPVFHSVGESPGMASPSTIPTPKGAIAVWPTMTDGSDGRWQVAPDTARRLISGGFVRITTWKGEYTFRYYARGEQKKILSGDYPILGHRADGSVIVDDEDYSHYSVPGTQWNVPSHDASTFGTKTNNALMPDRRFPFPKSLYAVEDTLRFFVKEKTDAVVLDFFAGSGTTAHAVMRLNRQDGGRRQCISVTNNEVSADEQRKLRKRGLRPGDPEWEALGICDYITKPRVTAAITGRTPDGEPIKGDYKFTDELPMADGFEENAAFFTLTYESPLSVRHGRAFERVAPMLWLRAGSQGRIINSLGERGWDISDVYGVLEDFNRAAEFFDALADASGVRMVFFVTDDDAVFQMACRKLPEGVEPVRLYSSYLQNFEINRGRA